MFIIGLYKECQKIYIIIIKYIDFIILPLNIMNLMIEDFFAI